MLTKRMLLESLVRLLSIKPLGKITVSELCLEANINRSTFYKYYKDVNDLQNEVESTILIQFKSVLDILLKMSPTENISFILEKLFSYIKQNEQTLRVLMGENGHLSFQKKLVTVCYQNINRVFPLAKQKNKERFTYVLYGSIALVEQWITGDLVLSIQQFSRLILDFALKILYPS